MSIDRQDNNYRSRGRYAAKRAVQAERVYSKRARQLGLDENQTDKVLAEIDEHDAQHAGNCGASGILAPIGRQWR